MLYQEEYSIDIEFIEDIVKNFTEAIENSVCECLKIARKYLNESNLDEFELSEKEKEKYKKMQVQEIIELVEVSKKSIFINVLDSYNNFLREGADIKSFLQNTNDTSKAIIEQVDQDYKRTSIIALVTILLLPNIAPIIIGINIPRFGLNYLYQKRHNAQIESNNKLLEDYERIQKDFFKITDYLRTDYHRSNKKLKELKERALQGEDVIEETLLLLESSNINIEEESKPKQFSKY